MRLRSVPKKILLIALSVVILTPVLVFAVNTVATGFKVGSAEQTIDAHGVCKKVRSTNGTTYFVPTNTASEWTKFRNNKPGAITLSDCITEFTDSFAFVTKFECPNPYKAMNCGMAFSSAMITDDGKYIFAFENANFGVDHKPKLHIYKLNKTNKSVSRVTSITGLPGYDRQAAGFAITPSGSHILIQTRRYSDDNGSIPFYIYTFDGSKATRIYTGSRNGTGYVGPAISDDGRAVAIDGMVFEKSGSSYKKVFDNGQSTKFDNIDGGHNQYLGDDAFVVKRRSGVNIVQKQADNTWKSVQTIYPFSGVTNDRYKASYIALSADRQVLAISSAKSGFDSNYVVDIYKRNANGPKFSKKGRVDTNHNAKVVIGLSPHGDYLNTSGKSWNIAGLLSGGSAKNANPVPPTYELNYFQPLGQYSENILGDVVVNASTKSFTSGASHGVFWVYRRKTK